eukprot:1147599-Pelagomonas_calceolata.AAC.3
MCARLTEVRKTYGGGIEEGTILAAIDVAFECMRGAPNCGLQAMVAFNFRAFTWLCSYSHSYAGYMCAANLIQPLPNQVDVMVGFARMVLEVANATLTPLGTPLSIRVGIHTGPLMSGVIGVHRLKFTLVSICWQHHCWCRPGHLPSAGQEYLVP